MKKIILLALATSVALLVGCGEEIKSVRWYRDNPVETYSVYKKCVERGSGSENCKNAENAAKYFSVSNDPKIKKQFEEFFPPQPIPTFH